MNLTRQTSFVIAGLMGLIIVAITVLLALGRDPGRLIDLLTASIIPTVVALWAGNRADKAGQLAEQAVHNTNGRLGQLIQGAIDNNGKVDVDEYADVIQHQGIDVPPEQAIHSGNPEPAFSDFEVTKREDI